MPKVPKSYSLPKKNRCGHANLLGFTMQKPIKLLKIPCFRPSRCKKWGYFWSSFDRTLNLDKYSSVLIFWKCDQIAVIFIFWFAYFFSTIWLHLLFFLPRVSRIWQILFDTYVILQVQNSTRTQVCLQVWGLSPPLPLTPSSTSFVVTAHLWWNWNEKVLHHLWCISSPIVCGWWSVSPYTKPKGNSHSRRHILCRNSSQDTKYISQKLFFSDWQKNIFVEISHLNSSSSSSCTW